MIPGEDLETVRAVSTSIARELLRDLDPEKARHCDVIVEEYTREMAASPPPGIDRRHGFASLEAYVLVDLPAAIVCGLVVETIKFYLQERRMQAHRRKSTERVDLLAHRFSDEAVKSGLSESQARELTDRFTEILRDRPSILPP